MGTGEHETRPTLAVDAIGARASRIYGKHGEFPVAVNQYLRALRVCGTLEDRFISGLVYDITQESDDLPIEVLVTVPSNVIARATPWAYSEVPAVGGGSLRLSIFESPTVTDPGAAMPMISRNRINKIEPKIVPTLGPTRDADGELIYTSIISQTGIEPHHRDLILAPEKSYLVTCERMGTVKHAFLLQVTMMQNGRAGLRAVEDRRASNA